MRTRQFIINMHWQRAAEIGLYAAWQESYCILNKTLSPWAPLQHLPHQTHTPARLLNTDSTEIPNRQSNGNSVYCTIIDHRQGAPGPHRSKAHELLVLLLLMLRFSTPLLSKLEAEGLTCSSPSSLLFPTLPDKNRQGKSI